MANGQQILRECIGAFPDMTPEPEEVSESAEDTTEYGQNEDEVW